MAQDFTYPRVVGDYYVRAITALYPTLRNGIDFNVSRASPGGAYNIEDATREQYMDTTLIEDTATAMMTADPYVDYSPAGPDAFNLASIAPTSVASNSGAVTITCTGSGFEATDTVNVEGNPITTTFVSATQIKGTLDTDGTPAGSYDVTVWSAGEMSNAVTLTVT